MDLVSKSAFARLANVTPQNIIIACKNKSLPMVGEGRSAKINLDDPAILNYLDKQRDRFEVTERNRSRKKAVNAKIKEPRKRGRPKKKDTPVNGKAKDDRSNISINIDNLDDISGIDRHEAERLKVIADIESKRLKTEEARKKLISRELVRKVFGQLYIIDTNEFKTLGANVAPKVAAIAGVDDNQKILQMVESIDKEVHLILEHIKRELNDFLKKIEGEEIG